MKQTPKKVQGETISRRYNKYLRYKDNSAKSGSSFASKMTGTEKTEIKVNQYKGLGEDKKSSTPGIPVRVSKQSGRLTMNHATRLAKYAPLILAASKKHNVPVELICGVIIQESGGNPRARSHCGARGLMQLMPATARRFGVRDSYDPAQNIEGGTKYLRFLLDRFNGDLKLAIAGYNAGEGNVQKYGNKIPPFRETQKYVPAVLSYTQTMIDILASSAAPRETSDIPAHARRA